MEASSRSGSVCSLSTGVALSLPWHWKTLPTEHQVALDKRIYYKDCLHLQISLHITSALALYSKPLQFMMYCALDMSPAWQLSKDLLNLHDHVSKTGDWSRTIKTWSLVSGLHLNLLLNLMMCSLVLYSLSTTYMVLVMNECQALKILDSRHQVKYLPLYCDFWGWLQVTF